MQILTIPLSAIAVEDRLRAVDAARAAELAVSMREAGQITPIEVAPEGDDGRYRLIAGAHRVKAAELAGLDAIRAVVFAGSADAARLREIDENLYRRELSALDQAAFLAERRAVYERLFGPVKAGRKRGEKIGANLRQLSFFDDVAEKFGLSRHVVERALRRRGTICPNAWWKLAGTRFAEKGAVLDAIGRLAEDDQVAVARMLVGGEAKTVAAALAALGKAPAIDTDARELQALMSAWNKAAVPARGQFIAFLAKTQTASLRKAVSVGDGA